MVPCFCCPFDIGVSKKIKARFSHNLHISIDLDLRIAIIRLKEVLNHAFNILIMHYLYY